MENRSQVSEIQNLYSAEAGRGSVSSQPPMYGDIPGVVPVQISQSADPPPSYEEANDPNASPPSYTSLFGQVREARKTSNGVTDFLTKFIVLILGTIGCTILIGTTLIIPIVMIFIGSYYFHDCPAEHYIPIFLIVSGCFGLVKYLLNSWKRCQRRSNSEEENVQQSPVDIVMNCFLTAWFISGCVWVYKEYEPNYTDISAPNYCDKTLYMFSFWFLTASFIILCIVSVCLCCLTMWSITSSDSSSRRGAVR